MGRRAKEPRAEKHRIEKGSYGSHSSYASVMDPQEPGMPKSHDVVESRTVRCARTRTSRVDCC